MRARYPLLVLTSLFMSAPAAAQDRPPPSSEINEAARHFKRGVELFHDSDFGGALVEFRRAQQLAPDYRVLFNMGQAYFELQKYAEALRTFEKYLEEGGKEIPKERRAQVETELEALRGRVAKLEISVDVVGAEVTIDGEVVGTAPLPEPLLVSSGRRSVVVSAPDHVSVHRVLEIASGDQAKLVLELPPVARPVAPVAATTKDVPTQAPVSRQPQSSGPVAGMWVSWSLTGALIAGTAVTGVLALGAKSDFDTALAQRPGDPNQIDDARSLGRTMSTVSTILGIGAAVGAGVSTYLTVRVLRAGSPSASRSGLQIGVAPAGLMASGTF